MKLLAFDFSSHRRDVAVLEKTEGDAPGRVLAARAASLSSQRAALALVDEVLLAAGVDRQQVEAIAVGLGPGSYTGIRSAIALAQGWQLARGIPVVGVSSVDCLAAKFAETAAGPFWVVLDAQREEFYVAGGEAMAAGWRWTESLRLATAGELKDRVARGGVPVGPEIERWFPDGQVLHSEAQWVGRLAALGGACTGANRLEPVYLRPTAFVKAPPPLVIPEK